MSVKIFPGFTALGFQPGWSRGGRRKERGSRKKRALISRTSRSMSLSGHVPRPQGHGQGEREGHPEVDGQGEPDAPQGREEVRPQHRHGPQRVPGQAQLPEGQRHVPHVQRQPEEAPHHRRQRQQHADAHVAPQRRRCGARRRPPASSLPRRPAPAAAPGGARVPRGAGGTPPSSPATRPPGWTATAARPSAPRRRWCRCATGAARPPRSGPGPALSSGCPFHQAKAMASPTAAGSTVPMFPRPWRAASG